jgi:hypothetical protein
MSCPQAVDCEHGEGKSLTARFPSPYERHPSHLFEPSSPVGLKGVLKTYRDAELR